MPKFESGEWLDIPGCPGLKASEFGEILNVKRNRLKKQRPAGSGAMQVDVDGRTRMVHDLVARAFHGVPPKGYRVKHRNGDLSDNRPDNLMWTGTPAPEMQAPTLATDVEEEYDRIRNERLTLVELMQT